MNVILLLPHRSYINGPPLALTTFRQRMPCRRPDAKISCRFHSRCRRLLAVTLMCFLHHAAIVGADWAALVGFSEFNRRCILNHTTHRKTVVLQSKLPAIRLQSFARLPGKQTRAAMAAHRTAHLLPYRRRNIVEYLLATLIVDLLRLV